MPCPNLKEKEKVERNEAGEIDWSIHGGCMPQFEMKPMFVDRDGIPKEKLSDIGYERRNVTPGSNVASADFD